MDAQSWLLTFLYVDPTPSEGQPVWPLDPVRIQKGMFLLSQEGPETARDIFTFEPYMYGPCSFDLYRRLDAAERAGLVEGVTPPGYTWKLYSLTSRGRQEATKIVESLTSDDRDQVRRVRDFVSTRPFRQLLREVYRKYPGYAEQSLVASTL